MAQATRNELIKQKQQQVSTTGNFNGIGAKTKVSKTKFLLTNEHSDVTTEASGKTTTNKTKPSYKHIPHSQKPPHLVAKRNARERRRVQAVNQAFYKLRRCVPIQNRNKRVSKVKTLQRAIDYIRDLQAVLAEDDAAQAAACNGGQATSLNQRGPTTSSNGRILVSSQAGDEAEMRLAMSPEPQAATKTRPTSQRISTATGSEKTPIKEVEKLKRGRKPSASSKQRNLATTEIQSQECEIVRQPNEQLTATQHHHQVAGYLIESAPQQGGVYAPSEASPHDSYNSRLAPAQMNDASGGYYTGPPIYAYQPTSNEHQQLYQAPQYATNDYYQPFQQHEHHEQLYQPPPPPQLQHSYSNHHHHNQQQQQQNFYTPTSHLQVPYGAADSTSHANGARNHEDHLSGWQQPASHSSGPAAHQDSSGRLSEAGNLTQLLCTSQLNSSASSCSSGAAAAAANGSPAASAQCLYNGNQARRVTSMPADSTSSSGGCLNISGGSNKSGSLLDSPYSTASSASSSSTSIAAAAASSSAGNKSLDASAPLNLKSSKTCASAGGRQVNSDNNNYASNYAPPIYLYDSPQHSHKSSAAGAGGQQARTNFVCGGDLYLANSAAHEQQQQASMHEIGYHQQQSGNNFGDNCAHLMADQAPNGHQVAPARPLNAYTTPASLM